MIRIDLKTAPLSVLRALALSAARDIDRGQHDLRDFLEHILAHIPNAQEQR